jgi:hypothetical protein
MWIAAFFAWAPYSAEAAPQVLALIATDRPVALHCEGAYCAADLPTICVQPERRHPGAGREYVLAGGQALTVEGDGGAKSVSREVRLVSKRTHVAIALRIPRATIGDLAHPVVRIGEGVSAVPVPDESDSRPIDAEELAQATGPRRAVATRMVDREPARIPAVSMTNRLVHLVRAGADHGRTWARIVADAKTRKVSAWAIEYAQTMHDTCVFFRENRLSDSFRACIETLNDEAMDYLNVDLERVLKSGG